MGELTFGAFLLAVQSFISWIAKKVLLVALVVVAISAVFPILPEDPLRSDILTISGTFQQYSDLINWLIPVDFIVTSVLFAVTWKMTVYVFKIVMSLMGVNFMSMFTSYDSFGSSVIDDDRDWE